MKKITYKLNKNIILRDFLIDKLNLTKSKVNKLIDSGNVKVNNKKVKYNFELNQNDEIKIFGINTKANKNLLFLQTKYKLKIFYEDDNILIINKDRGIICQEDLKEKVETINNAIKKYLYETKQWNINSDFTPNLCHRLDKYTSGLIIAAKNKHSIIEINNLIKNKKIKKVYHCLVYGIPKKYEDTLNDYIMMDHQKNKMVIDKQNIYNKQIITKYKLIEKMKNYSKLSVEILTGKKHQIRVHLASIGHPLLGDSKYNNINLMSYKFPCLVSILVKFNFDRNSKLFYLNKKEFILKEYTFN